MQAPTGRGQSRQFAIGAVTAGAALLAVTRLPQLSSPHLFACGDEAIVGIMARRLLAAEEFPLFLYGQSYALAPVELAGATLGVAMLGSTSLALKVGALLSWAAGLLFYGLAVRRLASDRVALIACALLLFMPAWGQVSMMYTGGLLATSLGLWLIGGLSGVDGSVSERAVGRRRFGLGVVLGLTYFVHPLWLCTLLPFLPLVLDRSREEAKAGFAASLLPVAGGIAMAVAVVLIAGTGRGDYWAPKLFAHRDVVASLVALPTRWFQMLGGHYFLTDPIPMGGSSLVAASLWGAASLGAIVAAGVAALRERFAVGLEWRCLVVIAGVVVFSLISNPRLFGPRYLLPLTPYLVLLVALGLHRFAGRRRAGAWVAYGVLALLVFGGGASLYERRDVSTRGYGVDLTFPEGQSLAKLLVQLRGRGVRHVYSTDPMLQWNIMFEGGDETRARWFRPTDRIPEFPMEVDRALRAGEPVAMVGRIPPGDAQRLRRLARTQPDLELFPPHYFALFAPAPRELAEAGFVLSPASQ